MSQGPGRQTLLQRHHLSLSDIAVGCALGWVGFRFPEIDWRGEHSNLVKLYDKLMLRPSFIDTQP
jgi:glutathione S-transferase